MSEDIKPNSNNENLVGENENEISSQEPLGIEIKSSSTNLEQNRFECRSCGYIYDPSEGNKKLSIAQNTSFESVSYTHLTLPTKA